MPSCWIYAFSLVVAAVAFALAAPSVFFNLTSHRLDPVIGNVEPVELAVLNERFRGKSALVVGATRGIGRGVALKLAQVGADVRVVGRNRAGGMAVVESMLAVAPSKEQSFKAYSHDLFSVKSCLELAEKLGGEGASFDYVVFTVGMWPDAIEPNTADGVNKVIALDLVARFAIFEAVRPLLKPGARVMNVLASTTWMALPDVAGLKAIVSGETKNPGYGALMACAASADAFLQRAAARYPDISFIGMQPGMVNTDLLRMHTLPGWVADLLALMPASVSQSEEMAGEVHVNILSSANIEKRQVSYFNHLFQGRETSPIAYDEAFGEWLWTFLDSTVARLK